MLDDMLDGVECQMQPYTRSHTSLACGNFVLKQIKQYHLPSAHYIKLLIPIEIKMQLSLKTQQSDGVTVCLYSITISRNNRFKSKLYNKIRMNLTDFVAQPASQRCWKTTKTHFSILLRGRQRWWTRQTFIDDAAFLHFICEFKCLILLE